MLSNLNPGDTTWMLICSMLVFLLIPGLAFFSGGLDHKKNAFSILLPCFTVVGLVTLQWVVCGYTLAFGPDHNGWIGTWAWIGLRGVGAEPNLEYAGTIPQQTFMIFHAMIAVFACAILVTAFALRMKRSSLYLFMLLWTTLVYDPIAHWMWGVGGFLRYAGVLDFAGGAVIHLNVGVTALAMAFVLGKRRDDSQEIPPPHHFPFMVLGAMMLWFGWFGLTCGNALAAGALSTSAFVATQLAAISAGLAWSFLDGFVNNKSNLLGLITGVIAGLVAISPAAGFVNPWGAMAIGVGAAIISYSSLAFLGKKFSDGDSIYVLGVYGMGGLWGMIATGLWATKSINPFGANGLFYGHAGQCLIQLKTILAIALYSFGMSTLLLKALDYIVGLQPSDPSGPSEA